ncbi:DUF3298 and DUF4163 domain-containing protein [Salinimicrobium sp. CAU 1759]
MFSKISRLLLLLIIFSGCKNDKEVEKISATLRFEKESLVKKAGENCDTADYDCTVIALDVVRAAGDKSVAAQINRNLDEHIIKLISSQDPQIKSLDSLAEKFLTDYREAAENFSEEPPWEAYVNEQVSFRSDSLISVRIITEIFSGGAHGYKTLTFLNFDPSSGEILSKNDIFKHDFTAFAEQKFRQQQEIPEGENINSTGFWFEKETFILPENIGFSEGKVILVYNSYEIAPYAAGDIVLEIPLEEVRPFIRIE